MSENDVTQIICKDSPYKGYTHHMVPTNRKADNVLVCAYCNRTAKEITDNVKGNEK